MRRLYFTFLYSPDKKNAIISCPYKMAMANLNITSKFDF